MRSAAATLALLVTLSLAAVSARAAAPEVPSASPLTSWWTPNDAVTSIVPAGDRVYVSGGFTNWGPNTGHGVVVDAEGSRVDAARFEGAVTAVAADGNGGWYVGGQFTTVGAVARPYLAHIKANGTLDPVWAPILTNGGILPQVTEIVVAAGRVLVSGTFSAINGTPATRLIALNAVTGARDPAFAAPASMGEPADMVPDGADVLVASNGPPLVQRISAVTGALNASFTSVTGTGRISALSLAGDKLYLGGMFDKVNGLARAHLAMVDADTGALDPVWTPAADGVEHMMVAGGRVIVAAFHSIAGDDERLIGSLDPVTGVLDAAWCPKPTGNASSLGSDGTRAFIGGGPGQSLVGRPVPTLCGSSGRPNVVAVDLGTGQPDPSWSVGADNPVNAIAHQGTRTFLGGYLTSIGGKPSDGLVALDTATGRPDPTFDPEVANAGAISLDGDRLFVATDPGDGKAHVHELRAGDGSRVLPFDVTDDPAVAHMRLIDGRLWVLGFATDSGVSVYDAATGARVPSWPSPPFEHNAGTLEFDDQRIAAFGQGITAVYDRQTGVQIPGPPLDAYSSPTQSQRVGDKLFIADSYGVYRVDWPSMEVDPAFAPDVNTPPFSDERFDGLTVRDGVVYVYGTFLSNDFHNVIALDAQTGERLNWSPFAVSRSSADKVFASDSDRLYFAGTTASPAGRFQHEFSVFGPAPPPPPPPGPPRPPPPASPNPPPPAGPLVTFTNSAKSVRISKTRRLTYRFVASPGAGGKVTFTSTKRVRVGSRKRKLSFRKTFTAPASTQVTVKLKLSSSHLKALKRARKLRFTVRVSLGAKTFTTKVMVKAPKRR